MSLDLTSVIGTSSTDTNLGGAVSEIARGVRQGHRMLIAHLGDDARGMCRALRRAGVDAALGSDHGVVPRGRADVLRSLNASRLDSLLSRFTAVIVSANDTVDESGNPASLDVENPAAFAYDVADRLALRIYRRGVDAPTGGPGALGSLLTNDGLERTLSLGRVTRIQALLSPAAREHAGRLGGPTSDDVAEVTSLSSSHLRGDVSAWRLAEIAEVAFGESVCWADIARRGVEHLSESDVLRAASHGRVFELVATAERIDHVGSQPTLAMRVGPVPLRAFDDVVPTDEGWGTLAVEFEGGRRLLVRGLIERPELDRDATPSGQREAVPA